MSDTNQSAFVRRLQTALGRTGPLPPMPAPHADYTAAKLDAHRQRAQSRDRTDRLALLERLEKEATAVDLTVHRVGTTEQAAGVVADLVARQAENATGDKHAAAWDHPLIRDLNLGPRLAGSGVEMVLPGDGSPADIQAWREKAATAVAGVTGADFLIADTATVAMRTLPGRPRSASLLPDLHIAVAELSQVVADLKEMYALLSAEPGGAVQGLTNCLTLVTGPSRTRDIEAVMVYGVHGPREVHLVVVTGEPVPEARL